MPDPVENPVSVEPTAAVASAAPVETPAPSPAPLAAEPAVQPAETPKVETAPVVEAKPEIKEEPHPAEVPTLLEGVGKKEEPKAEVKTEAKPGEPAKAEEKPAEPVVEAQPAPEPIKWEFKFPEEIKASDKQVADFQGALESLMRPKEGETPSQSAQRLIDMHRQAMVDYDQALRAKFNETRRGWQKEVLADPMIGGAGHQTAMGAIARMRDLFISDHQPGSKEYSADEKSFNDFLRTTGAGDHPAFLKLLYRVGAKFDEPSIPAPGAKPTKTNGVNPNGRRNLYANTPQGGSL